ncbi:hypothetical protein V6N11_018325 [Hibiscus sabdariffa]|uniref:Uncharacterized protein n=1 Tax=Hibiscus sabdariffa TaxID=183260 RepID=A0ABR2T7Y7_9ROSI
MGEEVTRAFFPEREFCFKKVNRYGFLFEFQDKAISDLETKKIDRAIRRERKRGKSKEISELSGHSLSDSDLQNRWLLSIREAKKALELGKSIGIQIVGYESEAVKDIAHLDWN